MIAEVPETLDATCALFSASGYVEESRLTDYVLHPMAQTTSRGDSGQPEGNDAGKLGFVIPVTVDDLAANGILVAADAAVCWERSVETLTARRDEIAGFAVASDERIEAYVLYVDRGDEGTEILSLRSLIDDGGTRLAQLLAHLRASAAETIRFPKVHPAEISEERLENLGFRAAAGYRLYAARARSDQSGR
jgi:hypothetical protein